MNQARQRILTEVPKAQPWMNQGTCRSPGQDPEMWTELHEAAHHKFCRHEDALRLCESCPVVGQCRQWAQESQDHWHGMVVGGVFWYDKSHRLGGPLVIRQAQRRSVFASLAERLDQIGELGEEALRDDARMPLLIGP